jgi:mono/diheme cytochrome c family protein
MSEDPNNKHFPPTGDSRETFEGNRFEDDRLQKVHGQLMREKEEPTEGFSPLPLTLVALFMGLSFWAGVYMVHTGGRFDPFHFNETKTAGVSQSSGPVEVDMVALGKGVYARNCQACHQADGKGLPNVYPPLVASNWVQDNPERIIKVVLSGLGGPVEVNGKSYNNQMTPFGAVLSDQQVAAVLTYIRTDAAYANDSYPVSEELVAQVRSEYGSRSEAWTQEELEAIHGPADGEWEPSGDAAGEDGSAEGEDSSGEGAEGDGESATA